MEPLTGSRSTAVIRASGSRLTRVRMAAPNASPIRQTRFPAASRPATAKSSAWAPVHTRSPASSVFGVLSRRGAVLYSTSSAEWGRCAGTTHRRLSGMTDWTALPRERGPQQAGERETLAGVLDFLRATVVHKVAG